MALLSPASGLWGELEQLEKKVYTLRRLGSRLSEETGFEIVGGEDLGMRGNAGQGLECPWVVGPSQHGLRPKRPPPPT